MCVVRILRACARNSRVWSKRWLREAGKSCVCEAFTNVGSTKSLPANDYVLSNRAAFDPPTPSEEAVREGPPKRAKPERFAVKVTGLSSTLPPTWPRSTFSYYGPVTSVEVGDQGTVYIYFGTQEAAWAACEEMNGETVAGNLLHVEMDPQHELGLSNAQSSSSVSGVGVSTTVKGSLHSIKLTNIPLSVVEATLVEKCRSLEGFSSLKLVKVRDAPTNYAWVNVSSVYSDSAQRALNGMILDGYSLKANQPTPCSLEKKTSNPEMLRRFSFKLSDTSIPSSVEATPVQSGMIDMQNLPRLPSGSQSLFQPVHGGLDLSSAHSAMVSTLTARSSDHPMPLPLHPQKVDHTPSHSHISQPHKAHPAPSHSHTSQPHKAHPAPSHSHTSQPHKAHPAPSHSHTSQPHKAPPAPSHSHMSQPHKVHPAPSHSHVSQLHKAHPAPSRSHKAQPPQLEPHRVCVAPSEDAPPKVEFSSEARVEKLSTTPYKKSTTPPGPKIAKPPHNVLTLSKYAPVKSQQVSKSKISPSVSTKADSSRVLGHAPSEEERATRLPSLKQSKTAPLFLSEAATLVTKTLEGERKTGISRVPPTIVRHTQTTPVSRTSIQDTVIPSGDLTTDKSQTNPPVSASERNPFQQALARRTSPVPLTERPLTPRSPKPKRKPTVFSEIVECSDLTSKRVLFHKHGQELVALQDKYEVVVRGEEVDGLVLSVSGESSRSVQLAKSGIVDLGRCIKDAISSRTFTVSCAFLPCLGDPDVISSLQLIEKKISVDFSVVTVSGRMNLAECSKLVSDKLEVAKGPLCLSQLQSLTEMRLGYFWKVRNATTREEVGFDDHTNEMINTNYIGREPTCSLMYQNHLYTLDFSLMTVTDHTVAGEVHTLIREPVWSCYVDDEFGFKPLRTTISAIIESTFQQGASGYINIEGVQCVVDLSSNPMQVHSVAGESRVIKRQPEMELSDLTPAVTLRVRGIEENLASAEREFRQILEGKCTKEALVIPIKIQSRVTRLLLVSIARQYCVECVPHGDQPVMEVSGTKQIVSDIHRLLLQETVKIMSESETPESHSLLPSNWSPQTSEIQLFDLAKDGTEWSHVEVLMRESLTHANIKSIERIQNKSLWQKYDFFRRAMQKKMNGKDVNEKELFHGTRSNHPKVIYESEKGFDFRFGSSDCLWGQGSYFAVKASYSDRSYAYRKPGGTKQLILASVVTGESKFMTKQEKMNVPPLKPGSKNERYDTVQANTGGSEIYVVYDHEKAYPSYLISYRT